MKLLLYLNAFLCLAVVSCASRDDPSSSTPESDLETQQSEISDEVSRPPTSGSANESQLSTQPQQSQHTHKNVASVEQYNRILVPLKCEHAVRCGTIGSSQLDECLKGEEKSRLSLVWGFRDLQERQKLIDLGWLRFDPSSSGACLDAWRKMPCFPDRFALPEGCLGNADTALFKAAVQPGGTCQTWGECVDGYCSSQTGCLGKCIGRSKTGGSCGSNQLCLKSDFCHRESDLDDRGKCQQKLGSGTECRASSGQCQDGLFCDGYRPENDSLDGHYWRPEQPGKCVPLHGVGEKCEIAGIVDTCREELFCDWGGNPPICRERLLENAECRWLDACADGLVCKGLKLGGRGHYGNKLAVLSSGRCALHLDAGSKCDPGDFVTGCPRSMTCDKTTKQCRSTGHEADPCQSSWCPPNSDPSKCRPESCFGGHYCDTKSKTCKRQLLTGAKCLPIRFGVDDDPCFVGKCHPRKRRCFRECKNR